MLNSNRACSTWARGKAAECLRNSLGCALFSYTVFACGQHDENSVEPALSTPDVQKVAAQGGGGAASSNDAPGLGGTLNRIDGPLSLDAGLREREVPDAAYLEPERAQSLSDASQAQVVAGGGMRGSPVFAAPNSIRGLGVCSTVTLTSSPSPPVTWQAVDLTAAAQCTNGATPIYRFAVAPTGTTNYTYLTDWGAGSAHFQPGVAGVYDIVVFARASASAADFEAMQKLLFEVKTSCTNPTVTVTKNLDSSIVTLSAAGDCLDPRLSYSYCIDDTSAQALIPIGAPYTTGAVSFDTAALTPGPYRFNVQESALDWSNDSSASVRYQVGPPCAQNLTLIASPPGPQLAGTQVKYTASVGCEPGAAAEYNFNYPGPSNISFPGLDGWQPQPEAVLNTMGFLAGTYDILVRTRGVGHVGWAEGSKYVSLVLTRPPSAPASLPISENFDSLGLTAVSALPSGWKIDKQFALNTVGNYASANIQTKYRAGAGFDNNDAYDGGPFNFGAGVVDSQDLEYWLRNADRAPGWSLYSFNGDPRFENKSGNLYLAVQSPLNEELAGLDLSYDIETYRANNNESPFAIQLYYSLDGKSWNSAGSDFSTVVPGTVPSNFVASDTAPNATVNVPATTLPLSIPRNSIFYLAWNFTANPPLPNSTIANGPALALDNVSVKQHTACVGSCASKRCGDDLSDGCDGTCAPVCGAGVVGCATTADCTAGLLCAGHVAAAQAPSVCIAPSCQTDPQSLGCGFAGAACGPSCTRNWVCASDSDCAAGYVCQPGNGYRFGADGVSVCELPGCETAPAQTGCGSVSSECGICPCTPNCNGKQCGDADVGDGCGHTCRALCADTQSGCVTDDECPVGDVCIASAGTRSCRANVCRDPIQALQHCGPDGALCGPCQIPSSACAGLQCGTDPTYGVACGDSSRTDAICIANQWVTPPNDELRTLSLPFQRSPLDAPVLVKYQPLSPLRLPVADFGATPGNFDVTDRGAARYSIPIAVPPGRVGVAPKLALDYLSTKPDGYIGVGFSLSGLSAISTCGKTLAVDGVDRAVQGDGNDPYCLDGQRLIPVGPGEYRTEIDTFVKVVEGTGDLPPRPQTYPVAGFTAYDKNGRIRTYLPLTWTFVNGNSQAVIRSWAVARESDRSGNSIDIAYQTFPASDCPSGGCDIVESVPLTISYGANTAHELDHDRHIDFHYTDDRPDHLIGYASGALEIRRTRLLDGIKTYVGPKLVREYSLSYETSLRTSAQRLFSVQECATGYFSSTRSCHAPTVLTYNDPAPPEPAVSASFSPPGDPLNGPERTLLAGYPSLSTLDLNGDGYLDLLSVNAGTVATKLGFTTFFTAQTNYNRGPPRFDFPIHGLLHSGKTEGSVGYYTLHSQQDEAQAGIDKDYPYGTMLRNGVGNQSLPGPVPSEALQYAAYPRLIDVDGDDIQDLLLCTSDGSSGTTNLVLPVVPSTQMRSFFFKGTAGGGLESAAQALPPVLLAGIGCGGIDRFDVDGDGRSELVVDTVALAGFTAAATGPWHEHPKLHAVQTHEALLADINGDGLKDLVKFDPSTASGGPGGLQLAFTGVSVALNRGGYFEDYVEQPSESAFVFTANVQAADINGDLCDDLLYTDAQGTILFVRYGSPSGQVGEASIYASLPKDTGVTHVPHGFILADFNNDGATDIAVPHSDATYILLSTAAQQDLLSTVTDGEARRTQITYDPAAYDSEWATPCAWPARCDRNAGPVVSQTVLSSGTLVASSKAHDFRVERTQSFLYKRSRHGALGRGGLGFESRHIQTLDGAGNLISDTDLTFDNSTFDDADKTFPLAGLITKQVETSAEDQSEFEPNQAAGETEVDQIWQLQPSSEGRPMVALQRRITTHSEVVTGEKRTLFTGIENLGTDGFGNVYFDSQTDEDSKNNLLTQRNTFTHFRTDYVPNWLIALPLDRTVSDQVFPGYYSGAGPGTKSLTTTYDFNDRGILTKLGEGDASAPRATTFAPDDFGNIREILVFLDGGATNDDLTAPHFTRTLDVAFDDRQQFPKTITSALGDTQVAYDPSLGTLLTSSDPNETVTQNAYDEFGRMVMVASPSGVVTRSYGSATEDPVEPSVRAVSVVHVSDSAGGQSADYIDAFGRAVRSTVSGLEGKQVITDRNYDQRGLLQSVTRPHLDGDASQGNITYGYDKRRRLTSKSVNGVVTKYGYASASNCGADDCPDGVAEVALNSTRSPRDNSVKFTISNQRGQVTRVDEGEASSKYSYGPFDKLYDVTDPDKNVTLLEYDDLVRLHHITDPDKGAETYTYNEFDELDTATEDSFQHRRTYTRDGLGRVQSILDSIDGTTRFCYDAACDQPIQRNEIGKLVESISSSGIHARSEFESEAVDSPAAAAAGLYPVVNRGLLKAVHQIIPASVTGGDRDEEFVTSYSYNDKSLLNRVDYPASEGEQFSVSYGYDTAGHLNKLSDANGSVDDPHATFWRLTDAYQGLRVASTLSGDGTITKRTYDPLLGFLDTLAVITNSSDPQTPQDLSFDHYTDGLLKSVTQAGAPTVNYDYDSLDRLWHATSSLPKESRYSPSGNINFQTDIGDYTYADPTGPHRATLVGGTSYQYHANGDIWTRSGSGVLGGTQTFEHTGFHLPSRILLGDANSSTGQDVDFAYDAHQHRAFKHSSFGDRLYVGDNYERFTPSTTGPHAFAAETREHIYKVFAPDGLLIQVIRGEQSGTIADQAVLYVHPDQQGSPALIRDQDGGDHGRPQWSTNGAPVGSASWESTDTLWRTVRTTYTGHEFDEEVGLTNMQGRIYDQRIGRFMEADPYSKALFSTQGLNRYTYTLNSPLNYTDPSGFQEDANGRVDSGDGDGSGTADGVPDTAGSSTTCSAEGCVTVITGTATGGPTQFPPAQPPKSDNGDFFVGWAQSRAGEDFARGAPAASTPDARGQDERDRTLNGLAAINLLTEGDATNREAQSAQNLYTDLMETLSEGIAQAVTLPLLFEEAPAEFAAAAFPEAAEGAAISTPYALEAQSMSSEAQGALAQVQNGAGVFRTGQLGESMAGESQYWSLSNPLSPGYGSQVGLPSVTPDFIMGGTVGPGASVITNEAAALGANAGGGIQVVTSPGGVTGLWFHMP